MTNTDLENALEVMIGSQEAEAVYIGDNLIWEKESLPYDAKIEYLEGTGTQHIITDLYGNNNIGFEVKFNLSNTSSPEDRNSASIFGSRYDSGDRGLLLSTYRNGTVLFSGTLNTQILSSMLINTDYIFRLLDDELYVNDLLPMQIVTNSIFTTPDKIAIFALLQRGEIYEHLIGKIYYLKFFNRITLEPIAEYIPVRIGQIGYLYDKVSGQLFGNSGSGTFTLGPDIVEIEYLLSSGSLYIETGIIPDSDTGIYLKASPSNNDDNYIVGLRNDSGNTRWCIGRSGYGWYWGYGNYAKGYNNNYNYYLSALISIAELKLNYLNDSIWYAEGNNTSVQQTLPTLSFTPSYNIRIFGSAGVSDSYTTYAGKIYAVNISQGTNVVMDLIPVRVNLTGYMYDKVSNQLFGNAGSGNFVLGPDKT